VIFLSYPTIYILAYGGITFAPGPQMKQKLYSHKPNVFSSLQKKFQKIMTKIKTTRAYLKSIMFSEGTMGL